jgi:hypothetical protein
MRRRIASIIVAVGAMVKDDARGRVIAAVTAAALFLAGPFQQGVAGAPPDSGTALALTGIAHALHGTALVVTGSVENRGVRSVSRVVIDATGFGPAGGPAFFGSDGIPWEIAPGASEHFSIRLPLADQPVRYYQVQVTLVQQPTRLLATARRSVDAGFYHPLLPSVVRVSGDLSLGILTVSADVGRWPVTQVTVDAEVLIVQSRGGRRIETFRLDVPAGRTIRVGIGVSTALLSLRVVDVRSQVAWSD